MSKIAFSLFCIFILSFNAASQNSKAIYKRAFEEQKAMLAGLRPVDFKRAVFLTENAYYGEALNYKSFCDSILQIDSKLKELIKQRGLARFKTAGNWAVYVFMKDSLPINGGHTFSYDFDDIMGERDHTKMFVTKLLNTKSGNCHSLPYLYKILCEEIGASASLALAPNHVYIKHIDEKGQWTNIELTSGGFPRDQWIIKQLAVTIESIKSEAYMRPLSPKESISMCLFDLSNAYAFQNGKDEFSLEIIETGLKYFPNCIPLLMSKANNLKALIDRENRSISPNQEFTASRYEEFKKMIAKIDTLGHKDTPIEIYEDWVKSMEKEKLKHSN